MSNIEALKKQWFVDGDFLKSRLEPLVAKANVHCKISASGDVIILNSKLSTREQVFLVLSARAIASQIDPQISADVNVAEISKYTGLASNQVRARGNEAIAKKFAVSPDRGVFRALPPKIEHFLDSIAGGEVSKKHE
jgi:hypothetical protein